MNYKKECIIFSNDAENKNAIKYSSEPFTLCNYYPYDKGTNPHWDQNSGLILDVKDNLPKGINHFADILQPILSNNEYVICIIPTHEEGVKPSGTRSIAKKLCRSPVIDGTDVIYRIKERPKKTNSGDRDLKSEIESLEIRDKHLIMGRQVFLLDDVTTTGGSLQAGKILLEQSGADLVVTCALGKTCR